MESTKVYQGQCLSTMSAMGNVCQCTWSQPRLTNVNVCQQSGPRAMSVNGLGVNREQPRATMSVNGVGLPEDHSLSARGSRQPAAKLRSTNGPTFPKSL